MGIRSLSRYVLRFYWRNLQYLVESNSVQASVPKLQLKMQTCRGPDDDDCLTCDEYGSYPHHEPGRFYGGWCRECTLDSHCSSGQVCTSNTCVDSSGSPYSCNPIDCASGTYRTAWEYDPDPDTCCSSFGGACNLYTTPKKPVCSECIETSHCPSKFKCGASYTCVNAACSGSMPSKSTRTKSGSKHVVKLKSVTVKVHEGEGRGNHEYYARAQYSGSWSDKISLPCLTYMEASEKLAIGAEVAIISCGESFRFGIWEDDGVSIFGWNPLDYPMGDRWFSSLDFLVSSTLSRIGKH